MSNPYPWIKDSQYGITPLVTGYLEVTNSAVGASSFILTDGTSNGSTWSGTCRVSIVLTRLS